MIAITLPNVEATALRQAITDHTAAEGEPSGYRIVVSVDATDGAVATLEIGSRMIPLGRANVSEMA